MRRLKLLLFLFAWGPALAGGQDPWSFLGTSGEERLSQVAHSSEWLRLLHYRKPFLRSIRSDVDERSFFLAESGDRDPKAELKATLRAFLDPVRAVEKHAPIGQPVLCAFPARRAYLARVFGAEFESRVKTVVAQAKIRCEEFETWNQGIAARGASLVFSSAYPNNPASMFGHTFLRLDRDPGRSDLRSYGVNFSAAIGPDENPVKYAIWGLVGGYSGRFDLSPYYRKVNEYAFSESRDLWEYRLSLTEAEVAQLTRHIWELYGQSSFDYYFLDENCSFQILTALEAVRPDWDLSSGFILSAIPVETVKHVTRIPGAVPAVEYRPSLRNQMANAIGNLTREESARVRSAFSAGGGIDAAFTAKELDALMAALAYEKERGGVSEEKKEARASFLRTVLLERSRRGKKEESPVPVPEQERPDFSHGSSRIVVSGGSESGRAVYGLGIYGFRHDFLDRTPSYNLFSEVRLLGFRAEKHEDRSLRFEEADLVAMASLAPDSIYDAQKSWKIALGWSRLRDAPGAGEGGVWKASGGYGYGWNLFGPRNLVYALASGEFEKSGMFRHGIRFSPGADLGLILNPVPDRYSVHARVLPLWDATHAFQRRWRFGAELAQSYFWTREFDTRAVVRVDRAQFGAREWLPRVELQAALRF